jgi:hypothetical protein
MRNNPNSNVAPGENSACRTAAATNAKAAPLAGESVDRGADQRPV